MAKRIDLELDVQTGFALCWGGHQFFTGGPKGMPTVGEAIPTLKARSTT